MTMIFNTMTNLTDHLTSLELSKQLHEAGFVRESVFKWVSPDGENWSIMMFGQKDRYAGSVLSCYLASELGEALPHMIIDEDGERWHFKIHKNSFNQYIARYEFLDKIFIGFEDEYLSKALVKLLLYLIQHQLIQV